MAVGQAFEKALDEDGRLGLGDWAVNDAVEERVGLAEVHDDGEIIVVLEDIEDLKDVRVRREKGHEFWFVLETLAVGGIGEERLVDDLAGVGFVGERVETAEDGSEPSTTDLLVYLSEFRMTFVLSLKFGKVAEFTSMGCSHLDFDFKLTT
ncbi:hypothetical protein VIGAN_08158100 [Vigna angularis var. angularis]|uniref:Uncharacterized protein n=1 Tax=Vigna angularis var. angularis TaxID=157739 RepID=A0A0S3SQ25_PHAAN|nr:hypothetical protein VIGAN_08158100 [Vigna angularis var. angularis]